jgi:hypothetical protein
MANVNHSALTDPYLHEPKGASTASAGEVYVADGAGSGAWTSRRSMITAHFEDISTSSDIYLPMPYAGTISKIQTVASGAVAGGDVVFTFSDSSGNSMGTITVTSSGSAAGDVDTLTPSSNNTVTASDYIKVNCDGGASSHTELWFVVSVDGS